MARPQKEGLEYFPLDVDIDQDDKLVVPIAKHGMLGLGVIVKLMMEVYKNGYYYPWTEKELYVFPFKIGVESDKVSEIVIDCINSGFFCINQYKRNHILTSYGFQKRFLLATTRRKDSTINERYLVQKELSPTETELLHTETKESSAESTQSKVKESKEKVKEIKKEYIDYVFLTETEFDKLTELLGITERDNFFLRYASWISGQTARVQKSRSAYLTILNWHRDDAKKPKQSFTPNTRHNGKPKIPTYRETEQDEPLSAEEVEEIKRKMREFGKGA